MEKELSDSQSNITILIPGRFDSKIVWFYAICVSFAQTDNLEHWAENCSKIYTVGSFLLCLWWESKWVMVGVGRPW